MLKIKFCVIYLLFFALYCCHYDNQEHLGQIQSNVKKDVGVRKESTKTKTKRFISLAPSHTEWVFALTAEDLLVGRTDQCDKPAEALKVPSIGSLFPYQLENILTHSPTDVLMINGHQELQQQLKRLGISVHLLQTKSLEDIFRNTIKLGRLLGRKNKARKWVEEGKKKLAGFRPLTKPPRVMIEIWFSPLTIAGERSYMGDLVKQLGGKVLPTGPEEWPTIHPEKILKFDPEVLFINSKSLYDQLHSGQALPYWQQISAVKNKRVIFLNNRLVRPGPRVIEELLWLRKHLELKR